MVTTGFSRTQALGVELCWRQRDELARQLGEAVLTLLALTEGQKHDAAAITAALDATRRFLPATRRELLAAWAAAQTPPTLD